MTPIDPKLVATAFVDAATPTLADVLAQIEAAPDLSPTRRRDLASGLRRVAKAIGWALEDAPADPAWLRPRIARVAPAAIGLSPKSWANAISDAKAALAQFGVVERRRAASLPLSTEWQMLWDALLATGAPSLQHGLGRFVRFLSRLGVAPAAVTDAHAAAFHESVAQNELPGWTVALIDRHLADHRPALAPPGSRFLFPNRRSDAPIELSSFGKRISRTIRREIGLEMNPHLFRHLAALVWLTANPGAYEVARRLLGHAELSSTLDAYAGFEAGTATKLFAELIADAGRGTR